MGKSFELISEAVPSQEKANELMEKLFVVASPEAVFGEPVEAGEYTVITCSEASVGLGFGFGGGGGFGDEELAAGEAEDKQPATGGGYGAGGGGGGGSLARPVAAIEVGPHGVRVEPIIDPTKIALAFFTTLVSMLAMMGKMRRMRRARR